MTNQLQTVHDKLEKIACLGNGDTHGNSIGNTLAIECLEIVKQMMQAEPVGEVSGNDWSSAILYKDMEPGSPLYAAPQGVPVWLPIETAPKDGTEVLVGHKDGSQAVVFWQYRKRTGTAGWRDGDCDLINWPTHWMPLPAAPKGAA